MSASVWAGQLAYDLICPIDITDHLTQPTQQPQVPSIIDDTDGCAASHQDFDLLLRLKRIRSPGHDTAIEDLFPIYNHAHKCTFDRDKIHLHIDIQILCRDDNGHRSFNKRFHWR